MAMVEEQRRDSKSAAQEASANYRFIVNLKETVTAMMSSSYHTAAQLRTIQLGAENKVKATVPSSSRMLLTAGF